MEGFTLEPLAEDALLVRLGASIDLVTSARVHAAADALRAARLPGITDIAPAYASLLVRFDPGTWLTGDQAPALAGIAAALQAALTNAAFVPHADRRVAGAPETRRAAHPVEIPVCYGGPFGPDLEAVAAHAAIAPADVVTRHAAAIYVVAMLGFAPGFPYLLGLDPALHTPRRPDPRTRVPAGSIAIGGAQTGIYPRLLPGGWQLIGRTPLTLFRADRNPPGLLGPGDTVRFRAIAADEFAAIAGGAAGATASADRPGTG